MSMLHREREIIPDAGTNERKVLVMSCVCLEHEICDYLQRCGACMMGCTFQGGHFFSKVVILLAIMTGNK